jgi:hypothetical protein
MKKLMLGTLVAITLMATFHLPVSAAGVPPVISYQGKLMQPSGAPVPDGTVSIVFSIYDVPTGGTPVWTETNNSVQVKGGLFSVMLGSANPIAATVFASPDRYFGIKVGADSETSPRQKIASTAYAQTAGSAETAKVADNGTPVGGIIMWSGAATAIPTGWKLCDGTNGTPNLRDKFIVGAGSGYAVGATGGRSVIDLAHTHSTQGHVLTTTEMPAHNHGVNDPGHQHTFYWPVNIAGGYIAAGPGPAIDYNAQTSVSTTGISIQNSGGNAAHNHGDTTSMLGSTNILPPYYALCFIMKVAN